MICKQSNGFYENCDISYQLNAGETQVVEYTFPSSTSCRYYIKVPAGYQVALKCTLNINSAKDSSGRCVDSFLISTNGDKSLNNAESFCTSTTTTRVSVFNYIVFCKFLLYIQICYYNLLNLNYYSFSSLYFKGKIWILQMLHDSSTTNFL